MNVVQLEAFESTLRGKKVCWFLPSQTQTQPLPQYPPGFQEHVFTESPPFQRKFLITTSASSEAWKLVDKWDIVFSVSTPHDWSLLLTLILYQQAPEHCLLIMTPEAKPPTAFLQKSSQTKSGKSPTIICLDILKPSPQLPFTFDAIFFPPAQTCSEVAVDAIQAILQQCMPAELLRGFILRDSLKELKSAGASLVVSSIESVRRIYTLYWMYATESVSKQDSLLNQVLTVLQKRSFV